MERTLKTNKQMTGRMTHINSVRGLAWGSIGGVAGTLVMDVTLMGVLAAFGSSPLTCFSIVGNTVARFLSMQNLGLARAIYLGIATHYVVGPVIGAIFGLAVAGIKALQVHPLKKSMLLGILR